MVTEKAKSNTVGHQRGERGSVAGVVRIVGQTQLPQEFITVGRDFDAALGRTALRDDNQLNAVVLYKAKLEMFGMLDEIKDLTSWLNGRPAIGGFNRSQAIMAHTGIYVPEGAGIKVSKETQKALSQINRERNIGKAKEGNHDETVKDRP